MAELKTKPTDNSVKEFLESIENEQRRLDAFQLLDLFAEVTNNKPKMWGSSIVGFGMYHYKSERSTQEGDWPLVAFSPRKQNLSLYLYTNIGESAKIKPLLDKIGKHKTSKGCLYINKLADVDLDILKQVIEISYNEMKSIHN